MTLFSVLAAEGCFPPRLPRKTKRTFDFLRVKKYNGPDGEMTERPKVLAC